LRPKLIHVTTVDLSLDALLGYQLARFQEEGFDVVGVSAPGPYVDGLERSGIRHVPVRSLTRNWTPDDDLRATAELVRVFRRERPAVVHTHNPKSGVLGRVAARIAKVPVIVNTVHGLYANPALSSGKRWVVDRAESWAMRLSHHELFQSHEDLERALRERMLPPQRASWLGNGVDLRRFDPAVVPPEAIRELRRRWGVDPAAPVVGAVGRLVREKGYLELFDAASAVRRTHPSAAFVVVGPAEPTKGDGLSASELENAKRAGVIVAGEGEREDMPTIYAAFDVFVLPSHREGMPRSLIEASAMQRPVVATEIRGCREVVEANRTGILVPPRDPGSLTAAIERLLSDPGQAEAMGRAGRARAIDRFDEDAVVERTVQTYRRLLRGHDIRWDGEAPAR
jgi:glycosyltransferase involved in cell wall biosynthesis